MIKAERKNPVIVLRVNPPTITPHYKISGILAVWPGSDKEKAVRIRTMLTLFIFRPYHPLASKDLASGQVPSTRDRIRVPMLIAIICFVCFFHVRSFSLIVSLIIFLLSSSGGGMVSGVVITAAAPEVAAAAVGYGVSRSRLLGTDSGDRRLHAVSTASMNAPTSKMSAYCEARLLIFQASRTLAKSAYCVMYLTSLALCSIIFILLLTIPLHC
jgi:hypothetical protein